MSYGAYFATQPSTRTYVDTSQPLNGYGGFGAAEGSDSLLAIYDGVAGLGSAPGGCGCAGTRGTLSGLRGFGNEVPPDGSIPPIEPIASSLNLKTAFVALLVVGSIVAVGAFLLGPKPMRANGRKRRMKRNSAFGTKTARRLGKGRKGHAPYALTSTKTQVRFQNALGQSGGRVGKAYHWTDGPTESYFTASGALSIAQIEKNGRLWSAYIKSKSGHVSIGKSKTRGAAKRRVESYLASSAEMHRNGGTTKWVNVSEPDARIWALVENGAEKGYVEQNNETGQYVPSDKYTDYAPQSSLSAAKKVLEAELGYSSMPAPIFKKHTAMKAKRSPYKSAPKRGRKVSRVRLRRNGAPAYLLTKKGKTTKRQAKAAGHYLAETRWHGGPKRVARWSGKHLAHKRFNTNGKRPRIMSGYGFVLDEMRAPTAWRTATNDSWEIQQVRRPSRPAKFLGARNIDGSRCNVFLLSSGKVIAQQTQYGHASRAGGLPAR